MIYTLGTAAKATGKSKPTIARAIKKGAISAKKNYKGEYEIDPSELHRVFPRLSDMGNDTDTVASKNNKSLHNKITDDNRVLQAKLDMLEERLKEKDQTIDDLRKDKDKIIDDLRSERDEWRGEAKRTTLLLEKHTPTTPTEARRGLFGFFRSNS